MASNTDDTKLARFVVWSLSADHDVHLDLLLGCFFSDPNSGLRHAMSYRDLRLFLLIFDFFAVQI